MVTLVAGGAGFIGINLVKVLAERGHEVVSLDIRPADALDRRYVAPWAGQVTFVQGDIRKKSDLKRVAADHRITRIVNSIDWGGPLSGSPGVGHETSTSAVRTMLDVNVIGKFNLLELASKLGVEKYVFVGSVSVDGYWHQGRDKFNDDEHPAPDFDEAAMH